MKHAHRLVAIIVLVGGLFVTATSAGADSQVPRDYEATASPTIGMLTADASMATAFATMQSDAGVAPSSTGDVAKAIGERMLQSLHASQELFSSGPDDEVTESEAADTPDAQQDEDASPTITVTPTVDENQDEDNQDKVDTTPTVTPTGDENQDEDNQDGDVVKTPTVTPGGDENQDEDNQDEDVVATPTSTPAVDENQDEDNQDEDVQPAPAPSTENQDGHHETSTKHTGGNQDEQ